MVFYLCPVYTTLIENVEGISHFVATVPALNGTESYVASSSDEAISDGNQELFYGDDEDRISLEGTIYISPVQGYMTYYINPVYQSVDGRVYVTGGTGLTMGDEQGEGAAFSQTLDETSTDTENGKSKKVSTSIKTSFNMILPPEKIVILEMDENSSIVENREYSPGEVPDKLTPKEETAYIIVETYKRESTGTVVVTRELFSREDETLFTFFCRKDGICIKERTQLGWESR